jgi:very-short-patch-repair endonuclease
MSLFGLLPIIAGLSLTAMNRDRARDLRRNMTDAERRLWSALRYRQLGGCRFRRQAPLGPYIVDYVCLEKKLIVELDGGQHFIRTKEDAKRTLWLNERGYQVIRFWNHQVFEDFDVILEVIWRALEDSSLLSKDHERHKGEVSG